MSKKKILCYVLLTAMLVSMFAAGEVSVAAEQQQPAYSNLVDAKSRKEVRSALLSAGISAKTADAWLKDVVSYNKTIKNTSLVKKSFRKMGKKPPVYNENRISKLWLKKNKLFIGYNCRITAYDLMKDYIKVGNTRKANPSQLFMDQDALKNAPTKKFSGKQRKAFESIFSTVQTKYTKNVATHAAIWAKDWKNKKISVSGKTKATLISVVLHSSFSKTENELFVGHTGVLVPTKNHKYLFIEKLSFQLPYQVTRFESKKQLNDYSVSTVMILGVAGGNGLEHIDKSKYHRVYGVDINAAYLEEVTTRYCSLDGILKCLRVNLLEESGTLPMAELVIANLLIEYIGYATFQNIVKQVKPAYVSCVIQMNTDEENWVSVSPYIHAFDGLEEVHQQIEANILSETMGSIGYIEIGQEVYSLPNGKSLIRLDYEKLLPICSES